MSFATYPINKLNIIEWHDVGRARFTYRVGNISIPIYDINLVYAQNYSDIAQTLETAINDKVISYGLSPVSITAEGNNLNITTVSVDPPELLASSQRVNEESHLVCWMHVCDTLANPFTYGYPPDMWASGDWSANISVRNIPRLLSLGCLRFVTGWTFGGSLSQYTSGFYPAGEGSGVVGVNVLGPRLLDQLNEKLVFNYVRQWKPYVDSMKAAGGQMMAYLGPPNFDFTPKNIPSYQFGVYPYGPSAKGVLAPGITQGIRGQNLLYYLGPPGGPYTVNYTDRKDPDRPVPLVDLFDECLHNNYIYCHDCEDRDQDIHLVNALKEIMDWRDKNYPSVQIAFYKRSVANDANVQDLNDADYTTWLLAGSAWHSMFQGCFDTYIDDIYWADNTETYDYYQRRAKLLVPTLKTQAEDNGTNFISLIMPYFNVNFPNDRLNEFQLGMSIDVSVRYAGNWAWFNVDPVTPTGEPFTTLLERARRTPGYYSQWCQEALDAGMDVMFDTMGAVDVTNLPLASVPMSIELLSAGKKVYCEPLDLAIFPAEYGFWQTGSFGAISTLSRNELVQADTTNTWYHGTNINKTDNILFLVPDPPEPYGANNVIRFKLWSRRGYTPAIQCWYIFTDAELLEMTTFSWDTDLFDEGFIGEATSSGGDEIMGIGNLKIGYQDRASSLPVYARITRVTSDDFIEIYNFTTQAFHKFETCNIDENYCLPLIEDPCVKGFYINSCFFIERGRFICTILQFSALDDPYLFFGEDIEMDVNEFYFDGNKDISAAEYASLNNEALTNQVFGLQALLDAINRLRLGGGGNLANNDKLLLQIYTLANNINSRTQALGGGR